MQTFLHIWHSRYFIGVDWLVNLEILGGPIIKKNKDTCLKLSLFVDRANKMVQNLWEVWILAFYDSLT